MNNGRQLSRAIDVGRVQRRGYSAGGLAALSVFGALLAFRPTPGELVPPAVSTARFSVAVLSGAKQAAQTAPENAAEVVEDVKPVVEPVNAPVAVAERETSLPEAVAATNTTSAAAPEVAKPVEVIPPARVAMPGGKLMAEDAPLGDGNLDPFEVRPRQVYLRLLVDATGKVTRGGVVRSGGDSLRDNLILKAMRSRTYSTASLMKVPGPEPAWQLDMVIDYGTNDFLP